MAKIKTNNTEIQTQDNTSHKVEGNVVDSTIVEEKTTAPKAAPTSERVKTLNDASKGLPKIEPHIDTVLKAFSSHKELYVDNHGGAFSIDTLPVIRKEAKLYQNPHYQL